MIGIRKREKGKTRQKKLYYRGRRAKKKEDEYEFKRKVINR